MQLMQKINKIKDSIINLIFPKICLNCGKEGFYLCPRCLINVPFVNKFTCLGCGKISLYGKTCDNCNHKIYLNGLIYAFNYSNPLINQTIKLLKYRFVKELINCLSEPLITMIKNSQFFINNFSRSTDDFLIIPIPLHPQKFRWRGFNQSELLAKKLAEEFDLPLDNKNLIKIKNTHSQTELKENSRIQNVKNTFKIKNKQIVKNKIIILIDDVSTTGSTLNEAAKILKSAGTQEVWGITIARG